MMVGQRPTLLAGHFVIAATTALGIAMVAGAVAGYAVQVGANLENGMDWGAACTTNISVEKVVAGGLIAGGVIMGAAAVSVGLAAAGITVGLAGGDENFGKEVQAVGKAVQQDLPAVARSLGREGENLSGIVKNTKHIPSITNTANYRIPDQYIQSQKLLSEVKNVSYQSFTKQLKDFLLFSEKKGLTFELFVRESTRLSKPLQDLIEEGRITLEYLPSE